MELVGVFDVSLQLCEVFLTVHFKQVYKMCDLFYVCHLLRNEGWKVDGHEKVHLYVQIWNWNYCLAFNNFEVCKYSLPAASITMSIVIILT